ncbi:phosphoenolpyruvate--protein phosphotransferase [Leptolyngbya sp. NK1-12]|uniref:Phosphocarrier protein HPr n=1 Tax=Leptolyngbya sp. NK1-12 TaxID=2547451 RepID=A0AA96WKN6_9CYAN|nr:phosphoenolpyruvate--protein phosphotransferase [Leptolyngbya sp. NK1-12]WNZ27338.1 phosphoenolpyruvate--protein phosphotransferase [Leptolyngbya sp. NK1-12]
MLTLSKENIRLQASAQNKEDAIQQVGTLLVQSGHMQADYVASMLRREQVANTYLGNGIAIPHGLPDDRTLIHQTGIAVLQLPAGVEWNAGEVVRLVVGIAAKSDEHLEILANLTHVLGDEAAIQQMATTTEPFEIIRRLTQPSASSSGPESEPDLAHAVEVELPPGAGLHARPATVLVNLAKEFQSEIRVRYGQQTANAKSLISLLKLGVEGGQTIRLMADGEDATAALTALKSAVAAGLEDEAEAPPAFSSNRNLQFTTPAIAGIAASPGLVIGPVYQLQRRQIQFVETAADPEAEKLRLGQAIETARAELQDLYDSVKAKAGAAQAAIFQAHQEFLADPELHDAAVALLANQRSAAWAWRQAYEQRAAALEQLSDPLLAQRATDLRDVGERVLRQLGETVTAEAESPSEPVILIAEDLTPSDTAGLDPALTLGFCTAYGGPTSHSAIIARSLDIPAIVGAGPAVLNLVNGTRCILDGETGNLYPNPSEADLATASQAQADLQAMRQAEKLACYQPALMTDGHRVEVVANIGAVAEAEQAVNAGAEGVGLLRTEFLFLNRTQPPSEAEQVTAYTQMIQALNGLPLIIRTLDIGGDKALPYLSLPKEENPFLGVRGIRLCFQRQDLFKTQLRAIFRAAPTGPIKIMFPMIATLEDFRQARQIAETIRAEVGADPVDYGMMIEVPSAVLMAAEFAQEVAFFSIGTNDLTQYTLAMDRGHPVLAKQADGLHPAVLRLIHQTVQAAQTQGKWVGVCGGVAGEPLGAAILVGLGVTELSVSIPSVAAVKAKLRSLSLTQTQDLAKHALACQSAAEVRALR